MISSKILSLLYQVYKHFRLLLQDVGFVGETVTWLLWSAAALGTLYTFLFYEK